MLLRNAINRLKDQNVIRKKSEFEKRLKLTEEQKVQAKQIRMKGHEEMKPVMEKIKALKDEEDAVRRSRIAPQMQEEKIKEIRGQMRELHKQARELRMKNMKEFESILTKKQLKELNKMKEEGRKRFEKRIQKTAWKFNKTSIRTSSGRIWSWSGSSASAASTGSGTCSC